MPEHRAGWSREFREPIALLDGTKLVSLRDAGYITGLPEAEAAPPEWQAAIEALMLVADLDGPTMFARIGMMRAFNPARKDHHWLREKCGAITSSGTRSITIPTDRPRGYPIDGCPHRKGRQTVARTTQRALQRLYAAFVRLPGWCCCEHVPAALAVNNDVI